MKWYAEHKRDLPWRRTRDPYQIWVSEIMLQQTQVPRVLAFYKRFLAKFPNVRVLANASWPQVLEAVRGLGYYRRFRNMPAVAKTVVKNFGAKFPANYASLRTLPGIGDYTANAILAFAFRKDVPVIDTNVRRVFTHYCGPLSEKALREKTLKFCPPGRARDFFQAVMDYARSELESVQNDRRVGNRKGNPRWSFLHTATRNGDANSAIRVAAAVIHRKGKILVQRRQKGRHLAGFWEFPGGKIEQGEDARGCLKREIKEELGIEVSVRPHFFKLEHAYSDRRVSLSFHRCQILLGTPRAREGQTFQWVQARKLAYFKMAPADRPVLEKLLAAHHE